MEEDRNVRERTKERANSAPSAEKEDESAFG